MDPEVQTSRRWQTLAILLLALLAGLLVHSAWRVGPTFDEHYYIASGLNYLEEGDFSLNREHPPLLKLMAAAPVWVLWKVGLLELVWPDHPSGLLSFPASLLFQLNVSSLDLIFFLSRLPLIALTLWMVVALWRKARKLFGEEAGLAAILLLGFNPNILAHGHLAALDAGVTAFILLATLAFVELLEAPSAKRLLGAGLLFGLANLAKSTALLLGPMMLVIALVRALQTRSAKPVAWTLGVWFTGLGLFSLGYGFETKSLNEAWGNPRYFSVVEPDPVSAERDFPAELGSALLAWNDARTDADPERLEAACARLAELENAPQELRKRAAEALLAWPGEAHEAARVAALDTLAWRSYPDLASWRTWFQSHRESNWNQRIFSQPVLRHLVEGLFGSTRPVPLFSTLKGLDYQLHHAKDGHTTAYAGRVILAPEDFANGNPYPWYYTHVLGIKNPLPFLLLFVVGLFGALFLKPRWSSLQVAAYVVFPALLFYTFSASNMLMGVRYVLPVIPFLALIAASCARRFPRATLSLAGLAALTSVASHPHELMYYNIASGGNDLFDGGPSISVIGDDWGQGVRAVGRYVAENAEALEELGGLYYAPLTVAGPSTFGLERVHPMQHGVEGIVAVHALNFWRDCSKPESRERDYAWLDDLEPFRVLDGSVYLFDTRPENLGGDSVERATRRP